MIALVEAATRKWLPLETILWLWHLWLTLVLAWWAFILAMPVSTFEISKSYSRYAEINPDETFWAFGYGVGALIGLVGTIAAFPPIARWGGLKTRSTRMVAVCLIAIVHGITAVLMYQGANSGTAPGLYVLVMGSAIVLEWCELERS